MCPSTRCYGSCSAPPSSAQSRARSSPESRAAASRTRRSRHTGGATSTQSASGRGRGRAPSSRRSHAAFTAFLGSDARRRRHPRSARVSHRDLVATTAYAMSSRLERLAALPTQHKSAWHRVHSAACCGRAPSSAQALRPSRVHATYTGRAPCAAICDKKLMLYAGSRLSLSTLAASLLGCSTVFELCRVPCVDNVNSAIGLVFVFVYFTCRVVSPVI
mmetsp:Transcript_40538/g.94662  ORF Transcript_40538/g.94662 Transcript_40538/m.94662 type:complete len:218 (-) Transcript_40538:18-671(-)